MYSGKIDGDVDKGQSSEGQKAQVVFYNNNVNKAGKGKKRQNTTRRSRKPVRERESQLF